jgi:L-rhamnose mutarotase
MQRFGSAIGLHPDRRDEYLTLHASVWPQVEAMLTSANIRNYTIFVLGDLLFSYYEYVGDDYEADMSRIAEDPETQRWWGFTDPCQKRLPDTPEGSQWAPMPQVWHLE